MGILSGISMVASLAGGLFADDKESSGSSSKGTSIAEAVFGQSGKDMADSKSFFENKRKKQQAETESRDPIHGMVAAIFDKEEKRLPGFITDKSQGQGQGFNFKKIT